MNLQNCTELISAEQITTDMSYTEQPKSSGALEQAFGTQRSLGSRFPLRCLTLMGDLMHRTGCLRSSAGKCEMSAVAASSDLIDQLQL